MKKTVYILLALCAILSIFATMAGAQSEEGENLLYNWCFCDRGDNGEFGYFQDGIQELQLPHGWYMQTLNGETFDGSDGPAYRPESRIYEKFGAPPDIAELFELPPDGKSLTGSSNVLKVFWNTPIYFGLHPYSAVEVTPGATYVARFYVYNDLVSEYDDDEKQRPADPWAAEARAGFSDPRASWSDVTWCEWYNNAPGNENTFEIADYSVIECQFTAENATVWPWLEIKAKWALKGGNNFWIDGAELRQVGDVPEVTPTPTPIITPTPGPTPQPTPVSGLLYLYSVYLNTDTGQFVYMVE